MKTVQVGVIGASGFVGAELISILLKHHSVNIAGISSESNIGATFSDLYPSFIGQFDKKLESNEEVIEKSDVLFICLPHGKSEKMVKECLDANKKVIDIGADFRLKDLKAYEKWYGVSVYHPELHEEAVYGLTEFNRELISKASLVANPGCYPTGILLGLYPAIKHKLTNPKSLIIDAKSGVTGAGKKLSDTVHFAHKNEGFQAYSVASHRHTPEIEETIAHMGWDGTKVSFVPHLLPVNRGILATMYLDLNEEIEQSEIQELYEKFYENEPFVQVLKQGKWPDIKHVQHSNQCQIAVGVDERTNRLIIVTAIDNMQKGAAGQAVQNFNVMLGLEETEGLSMVAPSF